MPSVTQEINHISRFSDRFQKRSDLQIREGRKQEVSLGRESSMFSSLDRAARPW